MTDWLNRQAALLFAESRRQRAAGTAKGIAGFAVTKDAAIPVRKDQWGLFAVEIGGVVYRNSHLSDLKVALGDVGIDFYHRNASAGEAGK